ncbi:hypothetical protein DASC09_044660 [Saccharomycopsis crataegensis]|uniref:Uncharacterized protein n=1 Tax=Saccharomycopsis crataegensis TaxID=43959 RepID=A0AAV5QRC1_9ASCO|nr:hypothetical protein DASC09_044660 [Saccharomycopsis crataegensis]
MSNFMNKLSDKFSGNDKKSGKDYNQGDNMGSGNYDSSRQDSGYMGQSMGTGGYDNSGSGGYDNSGIGGSNLGEDDKIDWNRGGDSQDYSQSQYGAQGTNDDYMKKGKGMSGMSKRGQERNTRSQTRQKMNEDLDNPDYGDSGNTGY